jgi:hypoxanthine phosphoribosyltransferase
MKESIGEIIIGESQIQRIVKALAGKISRDYKGKELLIVAVLKGSIIFVSDLIRALDVECKVDFISVSSYEGTGSSGVVRLMMDLRDDPVDKHILLVDEIADTGRTLSYLLNNLGTRKPASLKTCVLFDKPAIREVELKIDYVGHILPDRFVVGYGLDYNERFRNLPYVAALKKP